MDGPGRTLLRDPWAARDDYLAVLLGARSWEDFAGEHILDDGHRAGLLLDAQRNAVLMYTSCGWFFNDLGGTETVQILRYAARAIDLYGQLGEQPPVDEVLDALASARSNDPAIGDGRQVWHEQVLPAHDRGRPAGKAARVLSRTGADSLPPWRRPCRPATGTRTAGPG